MLCWFVVGMLADLIQSKILEKLRNVVKDFIIHPSGGGGGGRRGLGPRNDVLVSR